MGIQYPLAPSSLIYAVLGPGFPTAFKLEVQWHVGLLMKPNGVDPLCEPIAN